VLQLEDPILLFRSLFATITIIPFLAGCLSGVNPVPSTVTSLPEEPVPVCMVPVDSTETSSYRLVKPETLGAQLLINEQLLLGLTDSVTLEDNYLLAFNGGGLGEEGETVLQVGVSNDFPVVHNDKVQQFINFYSGPRGRKGFQRWLERSTRFLPQMREIFAEEGLPKDLVYLAMVESGLNTRAYSWAHAVGPWQFISSTGKMFGLKQSWWLDERRDFEKSTRGAAAYLSSLLKQFDGEWHLAVASYNAGPGKIRQAIKRYKTRDFWELSRGRYLQAETKNYLPKLMAVLTIASDPEKYGFTELNYQEPYAYETVVIPSATDLEIVAEMTGVEYSELKMLNPELKRWCTPPGVSDYRLRIPAGTSEVFLQQYALLSEKDRANYKHYRLKQGDTLLALSKRYGIRVSDIMSMNSISNPRSLQVGSNLVLPLKKGYTKLPISELKDDYVRSRRQVYTVRSGDSLWSISRRFGVSEKQLRVWNRLGWSNVIRPGQRLMVSAKAAKSRSKSTASQVKGPERKIVYHVKSGDTLWDIGRKFSIEMNQIRDWNNLSSTHTLQPGDKLTLVVRTVERSG
jgi:membrane-bound lytic murein transglycosylase D